MRFFVKIAQVSPMKTNFIQPRKSPFCDTKSEKFSKSEKHRIFFTNFIDGRVNHTEVHAPHPAKIFVFCDTKIFSESE
jgi:hypothetical protein